MPRITSRAGKQPARSQALLKAVGIFVILVGAVAFFLALRKVLPLGPAVSTSIVAQHNDAPAGAATPQLTRATFNLPASAAPHTPYRLEPAFPHLRFNDPVFVTSIPDGSGRLAVVERRGLIYAFAEKADVTARTVYLDIRQRVLTTPNQAEEGLLGLAFHPAFNAEGAARRRWVFVFYTARVNDRRRNRLSRFEVPEYSSAVDASSEVVLIDQPDQTPAHNAGSLLFGPDGFLYVALGDDHLESENAQRLDHNLFSGILRLDVDCRGGDVSHEIRRHPQEGYSGNYFIPNSNPFVGDNRLEEFYAIGLRNPWRMSFDRATGKLWVTDVGDKLREEINVVERGDNCLWPYAEGKTIRHDVNPNFPARPATIVGTERWPVFDYPRNYLHLAVIGGHVYRGQQLPGLVGKYVYADQTGRVYALDLDANNQVQSQNLLALLENAGLGVSSWGENAAGELYLCNIADLDVEVSQIYRLAPNNVTPQETLPEKLSETGLFRNLATLEPDPRLIPFSVNLPLFSDGADKQRWIALPPGKKIAGQLRDDWTFPVGTVFVKHFEEGDDARHPEHTRRLETRVLVLRPEGGIYGASYRWNDEQTDAFVVNESTMGDVVHTSADGGQKSEPWFYPGRFACEVCHTPAAGYVLGFNYRQLNRMLPPAKPGEPQRVQLFDLRERGLFATPFPDHALDTLPHLAPPEDTSTSLEYRVRSYLDANCSSCHRPGLRYAAFDARFETRLEYSGLVGGMAYHVFKNDGQERVSVPGDLEHSMLYVRMNTSAAHMRMPPLGREKIDERAVALLREWILSLAPPGPVATQPDSPAKR